MLETAEVGESLKASHGGALKKNKRGRKSEARTSKQQPGGTTEMECVGTLQQQSDSSVGVATNPSGDDPADSPQRLLARILYPQVCILMRKNNKGVSCS